LDEKENHLLLYPKAHIYRIAVIKTYPEILQQKIWDDVYHIPHAKDRTSDTKAKNKE
jgi:hypothetical protein